MSLKVCVEAYKFKNYSVENSSPGDRPCEGTGAHEWTASGSCKKFDRRKPPPGGGFLSHWGAEEEV
jgi:hypothetical protein